MKKIFSICMFCALAGLIVACNRYKTFDEEITALNAQYKTSAGEIFKLPFQKREAKANEVQQEYDKTFNKISKKWKKTEDTPSYHLSVLSQVQEMQKTLCEQSVNAPFNEEVQQLRNNGIQMLRTAMYFKNSGMSENEVGGQLGIAYQAINTKYTALAKKYHCQAPYLDIDAEALFILRRASLM